MGSLYVLEWAELQRKTGQRFPAITGSKKDSDRVITPVVEAVHVPAHFTPAGQAAGPPSHSTFPRAELPWAKKVLCLCMQGRFSSVRLFVTL